jgi:WD40 repeat protein/serine/threonine protein kinase
MKREEQIFERALALISPEARQEYLLRACGDDLDLRRHVEELLVASNDAGNLGFLNTGGPEGPASVVDVRQDEGPGTVIGRYKLLQQIGEGGMGVVYMAEQSEPVKRRVALKIIKLGMDTKLVIARFEAERQALAMMDHPNIAKILDAGTTGAEIEGRSQKPEGRSRKPRNGRDGNSATEAGLPTSDSQLLTPAPGRPYFVMELVRGVKITEYCDEAGLSTRERLDLFIQVCQAIQHAHQKGIIHRDIKPSNILITLNDGVAVPKVIDFGIAKATEGRLTEKTLFTQFEALLGTPAYMSPEQAVMSSLDIDTRSDIYSLGVLLYELLTGKTPFDAKELLSSGIDEMRKTIREKEPVRPSTRLATLQGGELATTAKRRSADTAKLMHQLKGDLDWIVMKCLEKDRARRYETANGLASDLQRHLNNEPVLARPPSAAYKIRKFIRRNKMAVSAAAATIAVLISAVVLIGWLGIRANTARVIAEQQLYVANMKLVQGAWEQGGFDQTRQLLEQTAASPDRGFEWYYWQRQTHQDLKRLRGHKGSVLAVATSPDGQRIVTGSWDHTAKVWDGSTGSTLFTLQGHRAEVGAVALSPDGLRIVTGSLDETARIWDASNGRELLKLEGHGGEISSVVFSPDGLRVITGSFDRTARVYDASNGSYLFRLEGHKAAVSSVACSPDGLRIATGSHDGTVKAWDASTGKELLALDGQIDAISTLAFSPDGLRIVAGGKGGTAKVWDAANGAELFALKGHAKAISAAAFFPDGKRLVTAGRDQTARVWDASDGKPLRVIRGHTHWINAVAVSANGQRLVTGSEDETAMIWDVSLAEELVGHQAIAHEIKAMAVFPDGPVATSAEDFTVKLWASFGGRELFTLKAHTGPVEALTFSPDGRRLATGSRDMTVIVWSVSTGEKLVSLKGHTNVITSVAFSPDGRQIVTGSEDHTTSVWDAFTGKVLRTLPGQIGSIRSVGFSPDGRRVITGGQDYSAKVWDAATGNELLEFSGHKKAVSGVAFSRDGSRIATASNDGTAMIWDAGTGKLLQTLIGHVDEVRSVAFSPDGQRVVTGSVDMTAKVWMAASGRELLNLKGHRAGISSVGFSPDGRQVITGSLDRMVKFWEAATPDQVAAWYAEMRSPSATFEEPPKWSQRATALFPEFFCLCDDYQGKGCGNGLGYCICGSNPGQRTMKVFIESLVDLGKSDDQIRAAVVARYGEAVKYSK